MAAKGFSLSMLSAFLNLVQLCVASPNSIIVTMGENCTIDGFVITGAADSGVEGNGVNFEIENCTITDNQIGVRAVNGNVSLKWCDLKHNRQSAVFHRGEGYTLQVDNCQIRENNQFGIFCQDSLLICRNSIIAENDLGRKGREGIFLANPTCSPVLYNNTIVYNRSEGIYFTDNGTVNDPNDKDWPEVQNCILWHNNKGQSQFTGFGKQHIYYSCVYDPNNPQGSWVPDGNGNISVEPKFAYEDPNNVRILYDSPCKDAGNPYLEYEGQTDMDHQERVYGAAVDMGAYEVHCEDISNPLDWNADGLVNFFEFSSFAHAWLSRDPNDPSITDPNLVDPNDFIGWNPVWDLNGDYSVGLSDLSLFTNDTPWLWKACWLDIEQIQGMDSGGEDMLLMGGDFIGLKDMQFAFEAIEQPDVSVEDQISQLQEAITFLERIWREDPEIQKDIDAEVWKNFMNTVYQGLLEWQADSVRREQE
ncbi:MAG TPA: right-handed parallel beta-helix repeat-containing protein [Anaerohalosphaeraceae bacterium]|nr:right-handed parallel beta-helix repeat-containing protein [Anaerohalosphaeraceae bacterium]HOL32752.1 right-handed parallel beta-helix repeat-containing protein [Anaerohalosphaeraceae bacterium]HPO71045.1 right-handed parallel beta-helix repeat-containing protein [Anaerohalosphaeraceae bacterium]